MAVEVGLNGEAWPWKLVLDSGSRLMLLRCGERCPALSGAARKARMHTNSGERMVETGRLGRVTVGDVSIASPETVLLDETAAPGREEGLLPASWFSAVYVDPERKEIRLGLPVRDYFEAVN
jgi:hypothetical protein